MRPDDARALVTGERLRDGNDLLEPLFVASDRVARGRWRMMVVTGVSMPRSLLGTGEDRRR